MALRKPLRRQPALDQTEGEGPLRGGHLLDRQPFPLARDEVPVEPLGGIEREGRLARLFRVERQQEAVGGRGHPTSRVIDVRPRPEGQSHHRHGGQRQARLHPTHRLRSFLSRPGRTSIGPQDGHPRRHPQCRPSAIPARHPGKTRHGSLKCVAGCARLGDCDDFDLAWMLSSGLREMRARTLCGLSLIVRPKGSRSDEAGVASGDPPRGFSDTVYERRAVADLTFRWRARWHWSLRRARRGSGGLEPE